MAYTFSQIAVDAPDVETLDDYIWYELEEHHFDPPNWWPTIAGAIHLYRNGMFGEVLSSLERMDLETAEKSVSGNCFNCGKEGVGAVSPEFRGCYETPDGEELFVTVRDTACDACIEKFINDLTTYGEIQPTLEGYA